MFKFSKIAKSNNKVSIYNNKLLYLIKDIININYIFFISISILAICYLPLYINKVENLKFIFSGDLIGFYWPMTLKTINLISNYNFISLDYSTFNGSSDFFLAPNFWGFNPIVVVYSLLTSGDRTILEAANLIVFMFLVHSFIGIYFTIKLLIKYYNFELGMAILASIIFILNINLINAYTEPPFAFTACIIPWCVYSALDCLKNKSNNLLINIAPFIFEILSGYIPLGIFCIGISMVIVAINIYSSDYSSKDKFRSLLVSFKPLFYSFLILIPFLIATYNFLQDSPASKMPNLQYSAHDLAEDPQSILRILSPYLNIPGKLYESSSYLGIIIISIILLFIIGFNNKIILKSSDKKNLLIIIPIYLFILLSIFGDFTPVSDFIYYFVPQLGKMHIYQRFLIGGQILIALMLPILLKHIVDNYESKIFKIFLMVLIIIELFLIVNYIFNPNFFLKNTINNYFFIEIFTAVIFFSILIITNNKLYIFIFTAILISFPGLNRLYDYAKDNRHYIKQKSINPFSIGNSGNNVNLFIKNNSNKLISKYVDLTPLWYADGVEFFPKNFPQFYLNDLSLSSYGGFNFYLGTNAAYMSRMPIGGKVELNPSLSYLRDKGVDFVIIQKDSIPNSGVLGILGSNRDQSKVLDLPHGLQIIALSNQDKSEIFNNGYIKISSPKFKDSASDNSYLPGNIAINKKTNQSSTLENAKSDLAVDGKIDGNFFNGTVTHTLDDKNAWFEIDLGQVENINHIKLWNRTDCCSDRLKNFSIYISQKPITFPFSGESLSSRDDVWSKLVLDNSTDNPNYLSIDVGNVLGRFVRIQRDYYFGPGSGFLSFSEIEIFRGKETSKNALINHKLNVDGKSTLGETSFQMIEFNPKSFTMKFANKEPVRLNYLFWKNSDLVFYLNGKKVSELDNNGFLIDPGTNIFEVKYKNYPLAIFWIIYITYFILTLLTLAYRFIRPIDYSEGGV